MAFPLEAEAAEVIKKEFSLGGRRGHPEMPAQVRQERMLYAAVDAAGWDAVAGIDRQVGDRFRAVQMQERTRMHFGCEWNAQCVVEAGKDHGLQSWKRPARILA